LDKVATWKEDLEVRDGIGSTMLYRAYKLFKRSRIRPIFREDIEVL
jgi:hypothetical protein